MKSRRRDAADVRLDIEEALAEPQSIPVSETPPAKQAKLGWIAAAVFLIGMLALSVPAMI